MIAWLPLIILALLAATMVIMPLISKQRAPKSREEYDLQVYKDQLRELEDDVVRGIITPQQEAAARLEIDRRILGLSGARYESPKKVSERQAAIWAALGVLVGVLGMRLARYAVADAAATAGLEWIIAGAIGGPVGLLGAILASTAAGKPILSNRQIAVVLLVTVPILSFGLYLWRGEPGATDHPYAARPELVQPQAMSRELLAFIAEQETHLATNADDGDGWVMLGRAYLAVGRFDDAATAVRKAIALGRNDAGTHTELVEALINANGGMVTPPAEQAIEAALAADPKHPAARYYDGIAKAQSGRLREAFDVWLKLAGDTPADATYLPFIRRQLEDVARQLNVNLAEVMPPPQPAQNPINGMTPEQQQQLVQQMVERLAGQMEQNPADLQGWLRLAQSYRVLERWDAARAAVAKAAALAPDNVNVLTEHAGIILAATDPNDPFPAEARAVLTKVLALDPGHLEAMYFLGIAAAEAGEKDEAAAQWGRLLTFLDPNTQAHAEVKARIENLNPAPRP